jgi:hypothetical protein
MFFDDFASVVPWLDAHSGAITAISTVLLSLITAIYVWLTALLLRQDRQHASEPHVRRQLYRGPSNEFNVVVQNLGPGIACSLVLAAGPIRGLPDNVTIPGLGLGTNLGVSDSREWPVNWDNQGRSTEVPLVLMYCDREARKLSVKAFILRLNVSDPGIRAGASQALSRRTLKRIARRRVPLHHRFRYWFTHRGLSLQYLIGEENTRRALAQLMHAKLSEALDWEREEYGPQMDRL